jgi:hypothetical protein
MLPLRKVMFLLYITPTEHAASNYVSVPGSKDNISVIFVNLPGAVFGDPAGGGVDKKRKERQETEERRLKEREGNQRAFKK